MCKPGPAQPCRVCRRKERPQAGRELVAGARARQRVAQEVGVGGDGGNEVAEGRGQAERVLKGAARERRRQQRQWRVR